jgi:hypothetical protein
MLTELWFRPGLGNGGRWMRRVRIFSSPCLDRAETWSRDQGTRALGPISMSIWEESGPLIKGL